MSAATRIHPLFLGAFGLANPLRTTDPRKALAADRELDDDFERSGGRARIDALAQGLDRRSVRALIPVDPTRPFDIRSLVADLGRTRHAVDVQVDAASPGSRAGKINRIVADCAAAGREPDWLVVVDDDVSLGPAFLDRFLAACEAAALVLAQPAHRLHSYASFETTQRKPQSLVRRTGFVEVGPVVAIHRAILREVTPLPDTRWGWGVDFLWAELAARHGWRIGIVDATPIEHCRPVTATHWHEAAEEGSRLLLRHGAGGIGRVAMLAPGTVALGW